MLDARFAGQAWFIATSFGGDASFDDGAVICDRTVFGSGVRLAATGPATIMLRDTDFGAPSAIVAAASTVSQWRMDRRPRLLGAIGTDLSALQLSYVDLSLCSFSGAHSLDKVRIDDWHAWRQSPRSIWVTHRVTLADEHRLRSSSGTRKGLYGALLETTPQCHRSIACKTTITRCAA